MDKEPIRKLLHKKHPFQKLQPKPFLGHGMRKNNEKERDGMKVKFIDAAHKEFFQSIQREAKVWDSYHKALFYVLGICPDCRKHIKDLFNFNRKSEYYGIKHTTAFQHGWHTSGSMACVRMAFNLWNGYQDDRTSPYDIFCCEYAPFFYEGVRLRYPDQCKEERYQVVDENGNVLQEDISCMMTAESYVYLFERECKGNYRIEPMNIFLEI